MKLVSFCSKREFEMLPHAWLAVGWLRGSAKSSGHIRGAYILVMLPMPIHGQWDDFDSGRVLSGYRFPAASLAVRRSYPAGKWALWGRAWMRPAT